EANRPVRNLKKWKDLCRDLQQKPGDDCVGDRNLVNIASLQLCEEVLLQVHSARLERSARPDCILPLSACLEKTLNARILYPLFYPPMKKFRRYLGANGIMQFGGFT